MNTELITRRENRGISAVMDDMVGQLAPRSVSIYENDVNHFASWLSSHGLALADITRSDMIEYRRYLATKYVKATAARMFTVARRVLAEAVKRGDLDTNPASDIRGFKAGENETPHTALTREQLKTMLDAIDRSNIVGKRDYSIISLMGRTGLRRAEAAALTLGDLTTEQGHFIAVIQHGKGDKRRKAKIPVDVMRYIQEYLEASGRNDAGPSAPLFVPIRKGGKVVEAHLDHKDLWRIVTARAKVIGVNLSPHGLRATFVTLALEGGAKLQQVQYAAGHADPRTTERYQRRKVNLDDNAVDYIRV